MAGGSAPIPRWARRLGVSLVLCVLLLLGAEAVARVRVERVRINDNQLADAELGFRNPSAHTRCLDDRGFFDFVTNSLGFRGPELPPEGSAPGATGRVLLLGDSFLQAWKVRDADWVGTSLREALAQCGRTVEAYSLSANDFGTAQELLALRLYGARVQPEEVVLFLFPSNDLVNNTLELAGHSSISANDYFRPYLIPDGEGGFERRYALPWRARLRHSQLFRLLEQRWLAGKDVDVLRAQLTGEPVLGPRERTARGLLPDEYLRIFRPPETGDRFDTAWRRTEALVLAVREEAERLGARFTAVVIPGLLQVERTPQLEQWKAQLRAAGVSEAELVFDLEQPERHLEGFFHRQGIAHVALLDPMRRAVAGTRTPLYLKDGHLNGAGHVLMGRLCAARLAGQSADVCLAPGEPVDVLALLGEAPLELDFTQQDHWRLFTWGWSDWTSPFVSAKLAGWGLRASGTFLARPGFLTLRGILSEPAAYPLTLSVSRSEASRETLAREVFAAPGPFVLRVELADASGQGEWTSLSLQVDGGPARDRADKAPARLVLQGMSIDSRRPEGWTSAPLAEQ